MEEGSNLKPILKLANLVEGTYNFTLCVTNSKSQSSCDTAQLRVHPGERVPPHPIIWSCQRHVSCTVVLHDCGTPSFVCLFCFCVLFLCCILCCVGMCVCVCVCPPPFVQLCEVGLGMFVHNFPPPPPLPLVATEPHIASIVQVVVDQPITSLTTSMLSNLMVAIQLELEMSQLDNVEVTVTDLYQLGPE